MTATKFEPIITTSNFLSGADALQWYKESINPEITAFDIQEKIDEGAISIDRPKEKPRYNLTAPEGRWQYELDEFWKNLIVVNSQILNRDLGNGYQSLGSGQWVTPLVDGGKAKLSPELLKSAWYDYVEPFGKKVLLDYKQYVYVNVTHHDEITWQLDFYKDEECDGSYICIHSAYTNEKDTEILQAVIGLEYY